MRVYVLLVLLVVARVAAAGDRDDARSEFAAGQQADKDGDYEGAIEHYMIANKIKRHPFAIYNIAADYERLGQLREAARWYEDYVKEAPSGPERDKVARDLPGLRQRPSQVTVRTLPESGARVHIDNRDVGNTPINISLPAGTHHIVVDHDTEHVVRDITLEYAEPNSVDVTLTGTPGSLYVYGSPVGALVAIDNVPVGAIPSSFPVSAGPHTVRVTMNGFTAYETGVTVQPGGSEKLQAALARDLSQITDAGGTPGKIPFQLSIGAVGGAEASKGQAIGLGHIGLQIAQYEGGLTVGYSGGATEVALLFRWFVLPTMVTPYFSFGYAWGGIGFGYELNGGLRWDISQGDKYGFSLLADGGIRTYSSTDAGAGTTVSGLVYPIELCAQVVFR